MANTLKTPKVMPSEFCAYGDKNTILTNPSTSNPQLANFSTGFPAITQNPIPNGGIPPERADFNGMFNLLSSALVYIQNGGQWTFVPEVSNAIGGYPAGAILNYYDATHKVNKRVISNINNNVNNFLLDPSQIGDSSKPWSYTENTPIVQDLKNPTADTVPSTKAVSDESSRIGAIVDTKVNKSGDTMTGQLINTFYNQPFSTVLAKYNDNTSSDFLGSDFSIHSQDNINHFYFAGSHHTNNDIHSRLIVSKLINGTNYNSEIYVGLSNTGITYTSAPQCNLNGSILTTVSHSYNYVRFGNGLQICWGSVRVGDGSHVYQNLPQAFKDTNYIVTFGHQNFTDNTTDFYHPQLTNGKKNTTNFTVYCRNANSYHNADVTWIAIGYWY